MKFINIISGLDLQISKGMTFKILFVLSFILSACSGSKKTVAFLNQCNQQRSGSNKYCQTSIVEIKQNLKGGRPLIYLGSDESYHYLSYYYDKTIKISSQFKVLKNEFNPKKEIVIENDSGSFSYPVYLSDL